MKSILLGSAAGIVAVASAQAADLPTKKAAPAEYVRICNVGGMAGFIIPGSDTCLKIGGYITAQIEAGNTQTGYRWSTNLTQGTALTSSPANLSNSFGWTTRLNVSLDARQNTAYGVLRGYAEMQFENGSGFDTTGTAAYINLAYLQWAGITAGKAPSFFSFFGGGEGWANIFSPDQQGFNQPDLLAYTATFGGGFSATIAIQASGTNGASGGGTNTVVNNYFDGSTNTVYGFGVTAPDVVANLRVDQSWGAAQVSGVAHQVHVTETLDGLGSSLNKWGWGVDAGVKFNLPSFGAGDNFQIQGVWTQNAMWYSGIPDGMWGENGAVNGNGLAMSVGDTFYGGTTATGAAIWATPTAWSIGATFEHHFSPVFSIDPQASYAQIHWSSTADATGGLSFGPQSVLSTNTESFIVGAVAHWDPVPLLDFAFELMYQNTHQSTPNSWQTFGGTITNSATGVTTVFAPGQGFKNNSDGVAGRFYITRNF